MLMPHVDNYVHTGRRDNMEYGYITQGYGGYGGHLGVDLSSSNKTITIYPISTGQLFFVG